MPVKVVGQCLGSMTGECFDGVADDGHLTCGTGEVGAHPGLELPVRRIELHAGLSGLLQRFGLIGGRTTRDAREVFGGLSECEGLSAGDVITGPIVSTGSENSV